MERESIYTEFSENTQKVIAKIESFPNHEQLLLLKSALFIDNKAIEAWKEWNHTVDYEHTDNGSYRLYPLVYKNLMNLGIETDKILTRFKGVYHYHWAQTNMIFKKASEVLNKLQEIQIPVLLLKGAPLSLKYYNGIGQRPMSDIDLMIAREDIDDVLNILRRNGFKLVQNFNEYTLYWHHAITLKNADGLELDVHVSLHRDNLGEETQNQYWEYSVPMILNSIKLQTLCDTHHLYHTFLHGLNFNELSPIRWIADAMMILQKSSIDWKLLVENAQAHQQNLSVLVGLCFLMQHFEAEIPFHVLKQLENNVDWSVESRELIVKNKPIETLMDRYWIHRVHYNRIKNQIPIQLSFVKYLQLKAGFTSNKELLWHLVGVARKVGFSKKT